MVATDTDEFLAHFGVKGMHWGIRKDRESGGSSGSAGSTTKTSAGVARVLGGSSMNTSVATAQAKQRQNESKAAKYTTRAASFQKQINSIDKQTYKSSRLNKRAQVQRKDLVEAKNEALRDAQAKRDGKLSSGQKKLIIGAAVVGAIVAGGVAYRMANSGEFRRLVSKGQAFVQGKSNFEFKKDLNLAKKMTPGEALVKVAMKINPGYPGPGGVVNCRRCTFAYEMRRRGFDVMATKTTNAAGQNAVGIRNALAPDGSKIYSLPGYALQALKDGVAKEMDPSAPDTEFTKLFIDSVKNNDGFPGAKKSIAAAGAKSIFDALAGEPNGSRGELGILWNVGGGHSMAYEIFDGKPVILDTQTGKLIRSVEDAAGYGLDKIKSAGLTRLDNVNLNEDFLLRWVKNT